MENNASLLKKGLIKCSLDESSIPMISEKMETYINEIILFNSAYNLTNTSDHDELVIRHILDSYAGYKKINEIAEELKSLGNEKLQFADIGSGGGLPGIPLATAFSDIDFTLVERMSKRCAFLENCAAILGLKNVKVMNKEAEKIPQESFDLITFRAFRPLDQKMTKTLLNMVKKGGYFVAYKAKIENIKEEMAGIENLIKEYKVEKLNVPGLEDSERNLVIVQKN